MRRGLVIAVAALAVGLAAFLHYHGGSGSGAKLSLPFAYSTNEEELLTPLLDRFNHEHHRLGDRRIEVVGESVSSGDEETKIARKLAEPVLWSPASSLWGRLLDHEADATWVPETNPSLVRTPLVIAMWKPEAAALGWPRKPIGFDTVLGLATSGRGWEAYGLPTFGKFKLGHTNPDFSTSGLAFVTAEYYTATRKREGLTLADISRRDVRRRVQHVQQSIVHYGDTGSFFVDQLKAHGPGYISAVAMEEVTMLDYNRGRAPKSLPLVAVYPSDGTFYFDNPVITLRAPWVTGMQRRAARVFTRWLAAQVTPQLAARYGYRPGNPKLRPAAPIDTQHYVDPAQPGVVLGLPEPRVLAGIKTAWHRDRKAANIAVVVDVSGSMADGNKLSHAQAGLQIFLRGLSPRDRVGLYAFSEHVQEVVPIEAMAINRAQLRTQIASLIPGGGTAVYDATKQGVDTVAGLRDDSRINAVVVLTDGEDNESSLHAAQLTALLRQRGEDQEHNIRVFTIAYGGEANKDVLGDIAEASGGKAYAGDQSDIADVYRQISSFF
jgi:Ca-activated chloride channel family protein